MFSYLHYNYLYCIDITRFIGEIMDRKVIIKIDRQTDIIRVISDIRKVSGIKSIKFNYKGE